LHNIVQLLLGVIQLLLGVVYVLLGMVLGMSCMSAANPGFDLRGAWTLSTGGGGGRQSLNVLKVEVNVCF